MKLGAIWRYPVKSMAGEQLSSAEIGTLGIRGDRIVQVRNRRGEIVTSRSHPALLAHSARLTEADELLVDGKPWRSEEIARVVQAAAGAGSSLSADDGSERFDVLPLLVATDGAIKEFGRDVRRLRPNLIIDGVEGLAEREWPGRILRIGAVQLGVHQVRERCVMTTYDPDTQARDVSVLRDIRDRFGGRLALDVEVLAPGFVSVGDEVLVE